MLLVNLVGGPGAGKSTLAHYLTYRCKKARFRTEFVGEAARELIYDHDPKGTPPALLDNQVLLMGLQYERILRLERHGVQVAISDSPLRQNIMYINDTAYKQHLQATVECLEANFNVLNVFVRRTKGVYDPESRVQKTEAEASMYDQEALKFVSPIDIFIDWGSEEKVADFIIQSVGMCE